MQIRLGEKLRKLRMENELTQEKLAEVFGVSPQAISRWENNTTYPDITMLPGLAHFYHTTLDDLMGMDELRKEEHVNRTFSVVHEYEAQGKIDEAIQVLREALNIHPHHGSFLSELALALTLKANTDDRPEWVNEAIALSERVLASSTNEKVRSTTRANLCFLYLKRTDQENAMQLARTLPHVWECRELIMPEMHPEEDYRAELRKGIRTTLSVICAKIMNAQEYPHVREDLLIALGPDGRDDGDMTKQMELLVHFLTEE
jgi:transcriptional regulator with XRE-family HTH domain